MLILSKRMCSKRILIGSLIILVIKVIIVVNQTLKSTSSRIKINPKIMINLNSRNINS